MNKIVIVSWVDVKDFSTDWVDFSEAEKYKSPLVKSVGWLLEETKDNVKICLHNCEEDKDISTVSVIPKGMIKEIKTIWEKKGSDKYEKR